MFDSSHVISVDINIVQHEFDFLHNQKSCMHISSSDKCFTNFGHYIHISNEIAALLVDKFDHLYVLIILALMSMLLIEEVENDIDNRDNCC